MVLAHWRAAIHEGSLAMEDGYFSCIFLHRRKKSFAVTFL